MSIWTNPNAATESSLCAFNLPCNHVYTLIGKVLVTLSTGTKVRLYKIRNPWRKENRGSSYFNGNYRDEATIWDSDSGLVK
jgi:hypothetical protein